VDSLERLDPFHVMALAPVNLWREKDGVMYQIQIKLRSTTNRKEQQKILIQTANSMVTVRRQ